VKVLFWRREPRDVDEHDQRLREAQQKACELKHRGEKVSASLSARRARNHWGETIAEIARGER